MFVRHRGNLARIWAGTERRVNFRGRGGQPDGQAHPSGKVVLLVLVVLVVISLGLVGGIQIYRQANEPIEVSAGPWTLRETDRATTGQQRVDRVAFAARRKPARRHLPALRPRRRLRVERRGKAGSDPRDPARGRPVALATLGDRFVVLETPTGDQRHVEPGWWETFDSEGKRSGGRHLAGYYPDDLAVSPDGKYLLLLSSGQAEGDPKKPLPALEIVAVDLNGRVQSRRRPGHL